MSAEKVWLRFEGKRKDGSTLKLRIQDMPPERFGEVIDLKANVFGRDEVVHKAIGFTKNPLAVQKFTEYCYMTMTDSSCRTVICCEDKGVDAGAILGLSSVSIGQDAFNWDEIIEMQKESGSDATPETKKLVEVFSTTYKMYDPKKELNLSSYLDDMSILVLPEYRGYGIAQQFLKQRRLMCAELGMQKTGGWMTAFGTQIAAERDGWETVYEVNYDDLAKRFDLVFEDAPPTMKYCVADPLKED